MDETITPLAWSSPAPVRTGKKNKRSNNSSAEEPVCKRKAAPADNDDEDSLGGSSALADSASSSLNFKRLAFKEQLELVRARRGVPQPFLSSSVAPPSQNENPVSASPQEAVPPSEQENADSVPRALSIEEVVRLFVMCPKYKQLCRFVKKERTFPLYGLDWVVVPSGDPVSASGDPRHGCLQLLRVYPSDADMDVEQKMLFEFYVHQDDIDSKSLLDWLKQRYLTYFVLKLVRMDGDLITLLIQALLHKSLCCEVTDTKDAWFKELGALQPTVQLLITEYEALPVGSRGPVSVPESMGPRCIGKRRNRSTRQTYPHSRMLIIPGVAHADVPRRILSSMLSLSESSNDHPLMEFDTDSVVTPPHTDRGHVVPPSIVPTGEAAAALRLLVVLGHCFSDGVVARMRVETPVFRPMDPIYADSCPRTWMPESAHPKFLNVLGALVANVYDCVILVLVCDGWSTHPECLSAMQKMAREHRLTFVLPRRANFLYLSPNDPTLCSFFRFVAAILPEVSHPHSSQQESLASRLHRAALKYAHNVLALEASATRPLVISHLGAIEEIGSNLRPPPPPPPIQMVQQVRAESAQYHVAQSLYEPLLSHAATAGTLGQINEKLQWLVVERCSAESVPSYFVLLLRGPSLNSQSFKKLSHNIKACHDTMAQNGCVPHGSETVTHGVIRELIAKYNDCSLPLDSLHRSQIWLPVNRPFACNLYPIAKASSHDPFVLRLLDYFSRTVASN